MITKSIYIPSIEADIRAAFEFACMDVDVNLWGQIQARVGNHLIRVTDDRGTVHVMLFTDEGEMLGESILTGPFVTPEGIAAAIGVAAEVV